MGKSGHFFFHPFPLFGGVMGPYEKNTPFFGVHFVPNSGKILGFPKKTRANIPHFFAARICRSLMNGFLPCRKLTYPTWRKGNSSFKSAFKRGYVSSLEGNYWGFVFHNEAVCCGCDFLGQNSHRYNILKAQSQIALQ